MIQELHHGKRPDWFKPVERVALLALVYQWLESREVMVFVARRDSEVIGYATAVKSQRPDHPLTRFSSYVELDRIVVAPAHRGTGVGRALGERTVS